MIGRANYNGTTTNGATKTVAAENASRQRFFFKAVGGDMVLNFGAAATAANVLTVPQGASVSMTNQDPYDIRAQINVYAGGAYTYEAQAEEMAV